MAEPSEGAYAVINVSSQKALDVYWNKSSYQTWIVDNARNSTWYSQTWIFDKQTNGWQITCAITWKCLDASDSSDWVQQLSDNNKTSQRWTVATDGQTFTYGGTSYPTYTIKPKNKASKSLSTYSSGWVGLSSSTSGNALRWILVPVSAISSNGTYMLVPESEASSKSPRCVEIASGSKSDGANARINKIADKDYQVFKATVNGENFSVKLINVTSGKALDIWENAKKVPNNVGQYTVNNDSSSSTEWSQRWMIFKAGNTKINGNTVATYSLRSEKYTGYGMAVDGTNVCVKAWNVNDKTQRFAFVKTEILGTKLTVPTAIKDTLVVRDSAGSFKLSGLTFGSNYNYFQVRFKIKYYKTGGSLSSETAWANIKDNSSANNGWGTAWTYSFKATPSAGIIKMPDLPTKITLNRSDKVSADVLFEVRVYTSNYQSKGYNAHSSTRSTTVKVRQKPIITLKSMGFIMVAGKTANLDRIGIQITLNEPLNVPLQSVRARLIGSDSIPISNWLKVSSLTLNFVAGKELYRLPNQNEKLKLEYILITKDNVLVDGVISEKFVYTEAGSTSVTYAKSTNGSLTVIIKTPRHKADCCFMSVKFLSGTKLIPCIYHKIENNEIQWICAPPLNKDVNILVYSQNGNTPTQVLYGSTTIRLDSHASIWNWGSSPKAKYTQFATLVVNPDSPPKQTRTYTTDTVFHKPAGRVLPVSFSSRSLDIDVSISGISMDSDANYISLMPLPPHNQVEYLVLLSELGGKGIHPIYRTPYGDWHQVAINSVDISKSTIGYSDVTVNQKAIED